MRRAKDAHVHNYMDKRVYCIAEAVSHGLSLAGNCFPWQRKYGGIQEIPKLTVSCTVMARESAVDDHEFVEQRTGA